MRLLPGIIALLTLSVAGCGKKHTEDKVTYFDGSDAKMNAAMDKARATVDDFIAARKSPIVGQSGFSVKAPFADGTNIEHFWLSPVSFDGTNFQGTINNEPAKVKTVKMGQKVTVAKDKISDWMYVEHLKLKGGYTLRVMRDAMSPAERADFDKTVPFVVD